MRSMVSAVMKSLVFRTSSEVFRPDDSLKKWIEARNNEIQVAVTQVSFGKMVGWRFDQKNGNLVHDSGKFFSIVGLDVYLNNQIPVLA